MKKLALTVLCLGALAGCMTAPVTSDESQGPADKDLAGTEEVAESEDALQGGLLPSGLVDVACPLGLRTATYNPGMTLVPRELTLTRAGSFGGCISPTRPSLNSGVLETASAHVTFSCLLASSNDNQTIHWNDGTWSTFSAASIVNAKPNGTTVVVSTGPVTDGLFKGSQIEIVVTLLATDLLGCYTEEGVTASSGAAALTITAPL